MTFLQYILWMIIAIGIIAVLWFMFIEGNVYAQSNKTTVAISPPNPTPTQPNPNLQYLPQKAFVYSFAPESGVPPATPMQALPVTPTVTPSVPVQQPVAVQSGGSIIDSLGGYTGITAMLAAAGVYLKTRVLDKKTEKVAEVTREQSAQIVKGAQVDQKISEQVYENMTDKGESINDKPQIKLETLKDNVEEATKTATKA
jgi:hypothetical protein